jgi:glycosyltransferase involved in cell wall biosynthesis
MKIIYLTWGETPRSYGVFGSQAINQFVSNCKLNKDSECHLISAVPLIHSGFVREKVGYFDEIKKIKSLLGRISFSWIPIYATQNFINSNRFTFKLMHGLSHLHLLNKIKEIKPDIIHCRSYHAAWAAIKVRDKYNLNYKVVFDGRDLWPEEMALKQGFKEQSLDYKYLKNIEKFILEKADCSVSVSQKMHEHYVGLGAKKDVCIYLSADVKKLSQGLISKSSSKNACVNFCYLGALSDSTWHKTTELAKLYTHLKRVMPNSKLTIITTSNYGEINTIFKKYNLTDYVLKTTRTVAELQVLLSEQDFGLMSYFVPGNNLQKKLGSILLSNSVV